MPRLNRRRQRKPTSLRKKFVGTVLILALIALAMTLVYESRMNRLEKRMERAQNRLPTPEQPAAGTAEIYWEEPRNVPVR